MANVNQERLKLFIDALRSGAYEQTRMALVDRAGDGRALGYCCLGVATEVALLNGLVPTEDPWHGHDEILSPEVRDWYGFNECNPELWEGPRGQQASYWNDSMGATFHAIANMFEETYGAKAPTARQSPAAQPEVDSGTSD